MTPQKCSDKPKHDSISNEFGLASCLDLLQILHPHQSSIWDDFLATHAARNPNIIGIKRKFRIFSSKPRFCFPILNAHSKLVTRRVLAGDQLVEVLTVATKDEMANIRDIRSIQKERFEMV